MKKSAVVFILWAKKLSCWLCDSSPGSQEFVDKTGEENVVFIDPIGAVVIGAYILVSWWQTGLGQWLSTQFVCLLLSLPVLVSHVMQSHTHTHTHTHSISLSLMHTHSLSLPLTCTHTHTHIHTHMQAQHTHTDTHTHTHTHLLREFYHVCMQKNGMCRDLWQSYRLLKFLAECCSRVHGEVLQQRGKRRERKRVHAKFCATFLFIAKSTTS